MNDKTLTKLGLTALVLLGIGLAARDSQGPEKTKISEEAALFPALADELNDVAAISVAHSQGAWSVSRTEEGWGLDSKGGYPVRVEEVRKLLITLSDAEKIEAKTKVASSYPRLGVEGPGKEDSESKLLTLTDANGEAIAAVIVGNRRAGAGDPSYYVRAADSEQSWLVSGDLTLSEDSDSWLDKKILELTRERIRAVETLHPDMEEVFVARPTKDVEQFEVHNIPEGSELKYEAVAAGMGSALQYLNFVDVQPLTDFEAPEETPVETTFWTFDGLRVDVSIYTVEEKPYATFAVSPGGDGPERLATTGPPAPAEVGPEPADAAEAPEEEPGRTDEEIAAEVDELNTQVSGWVFELAPYNKTNLAKHMEDLIQPIVVEEEAPAIDAPLIQDTTNTPEPPGVLRIPIIEEEAQEEGDLPEDGR